MVDVINTHLRKVLIASYERECQCCRGTVHDDSKLHVHHLLPKSKGGPDELENYTLTCQRCNLQLNNTVLEDPLFSFLRTIAKRRAKSLRKKVIALGSANGKKKKKESQDPKLSTNGITWDKIPVDGLIDGLYMSFCLPINLLSLKIYQLLIRNQDRFAFASQNDSMQLTPKKAEQSLPKSIQKRLPFGSKEVEWDMNRLHQYLNLPTQDIWEAFMWLVRIHFSYHNGGFNLINGVILTHHDDEVLGEELSISYATTQKYKHGKEILLSSLMSLESRIEA